MVIGSCSTPYSKSRERVAVLASNVVEQLWFGDDDPAATIQASESFSGALGRALGLRAFPGAASQALALLADPDRDAADVAEVLRADPALSVRVLSLANSAYFAGASRCTDLREALARLGNRAAGEAVLRVAALGMFEDRTGVATLVRDHSVAVAAVAKTLAIEWGMTRPEAVHAAGLLADIGKLIAQESGDIDYGQVPPALLETPERVHVLERLWTGWDHAVLGGHLVHAWQLPDEIAEAVAWHHQPARAYEAGGSLAITVALIRIADAVEYQLRRRPDVDLAFIDSLAAGADLEYAGFSPERIAAMWPKLEAARRDALNAFIVRR
jgi:putative nucleotidyltransferase with HDIG domain